MAITPELIVQVLGDYQYGMFGGIGAFANFFYYIENRRVEGKRRLTMLNLVSSLVVGFWLGWVAGTLLPDSSHKSGIIMLAGFYFQPILSTAEVVVVERVKKFLPPKTGT